MFLVSLLLFQSSPLEGSHRLDFDDEGFHVNTHIWVSSVIRLFAGQRSSCGVQPPRTYSSPCRLMAEWQRKGPQPAASSAQRPPQHAGRHHLLVALSQVAVTVRWRASPSSPSPHTGAAGGGGAQGHPAARPPSSYLQQCDVTLKSQ